MTHDEIAEVVAAHAAVARNSSKRARRHRAHDRAWPPAAAVPVAGMQCRADAYGGSEANRMRFARETLAAVRAAVGDDVTVGIRISADEYCPAPDARRHAAHRAALARTARIDFVNVSHSAYHGSTTIATQIADMAFTQDHFHACARHRGFAGALPIRRRARGMPVSHRRGSGRDARRRPHRDGRMARAHIADPALVARRAPAARRRRGRASAATRAARISWRSACDHLPDQPRVGPSASAADDRAAARKRVLVIAAGRGARGRAVAARRGHDVTLWEASERLGGQLDWIRRMPHRRDFLALLDTRRTRPPRRRRLVLQRRADPAAIIAHRPDAVIVATAAPRRRSPSPARRGLTMEQRCRRGAGRARRGARHARQLRDRCADRASRAQRQARHRAGADRRAGLAHHALQQLRWRQRLKDLGVRIVGHCTVQAFAAARPAARPVDRRVTMTRDFDAIVAPTHGVPNDDLVDASAQ